VDGLVGQLSFAKDFINTFCEIRAKKCTALHGLFSALGRKFFTEEGGGRVRGRERQRERECVCVREREKERERERGG